MIHPLLKARIEQLAERFYGGLMRCHRCLGQIAEAISVYDRCRALLRTTHGIEPSPEIESLRRSLTNGGD